MSKEYTVVRADHKEDWEGDWGPMKTFSLELEEAPVGSGILHQVEMNQKSKTAPPKAGEVISGEITPRRPGLPDKFKKEFKEGGTLKGEHPKGGSTFKPRDPSEIAGARHARSSARRPTPCASDSARSSGDSSRSNSTALSRGCARP